MKCYCNSEECQSRNTNHCFTRFFCYAEFYSNPNRDGIARQDPPTRRSGEYVVGDDTQYSDKTMVNYGCINNKMPILCDRKLIRSGPVLQCCRTPMCNIRASPRRQTSKKRWSSRSTPLLLATSKSPSQSSNSIASDSYDGVHHSPSLHNLLLNNPITIALPITIACVLLALVLFLIFLTKRREMSSAMTATSSKQDKSQHSRHLLPMFPTDSHENRLPPPVYTFPMGHAPPLTWLTSSSLQSQYYLHQPEREFLGKYNFLPPDHNLNFYPKQ